MPTDNWQDWCSCPQLSNLLYGYCLGLSLAYLGLSLALGVEYGHLLVGLSLVYYGCLLAFRLKYGSSLLALARKNGGTLVAFCLHLLLHCLKHALRRCDVLELNAVNLNTPFVGGIVEHGAQLGVYRVARCERLVEFKLSDDVTQSGLRKFLDGIGQIAYLVNSLERVDNLKIKQGVDLRLHIVFCNHVLLVEVVDLLTKVDRVAVDVAAAAHGYNLLGAVNKRYDDVYSVSQVNKLIKALVEGERRFANIQVRGEISNFKRYSSGHCYFTLKDAGGVLKAVMFKTAARTLRFEPQNGDTVIAVGRISVYERDGVYQLYTDLMIPEGTGDLMLAFEQLKQKLLSEGLV